MTREEKFIWDEFGERKRECDRTIAELEALLSEEADPPHRPFVLDDIKHERRIKSIISMAIAD